MTTPSAIQVRQPGLSAPSNIVQIAQRPDILTIIADETAEQALIGLVLSKPDLFPSVNDGFDVENFYYGFTKLAWKAIQQLCDSGDGFDLSVVPQKMQQLEPTLITDLTDTNLRLVKMIGKTSRNSNPDTYVKNINRAALRRKYLMAADAMAAVALDISQDEDTIIEAGERILIETTRRQHLQDTSVLAAVSAYYDKMELLSGAHKKLSVKTGFPQLDEGLGGLVPGNVNVLAGSEGMGKTTLLLTMIRAMCQAGLSVVLFTLEMTRDEIIQAFIAMEQGINKLSLKTGTLSPEEWKRFVDATGEISQWKLHIVDEFPELTPLQLRRKLRRLMVDTSFDLIGIDGLWLMEPTVKSKEGRWRDVNNITRDLTTLAKPVPHGVYLPILITHQYNSEVKNAAKSSPTLYWLSESAAVRRNAQVVLAMHRVSVFDPDTYNPEIPETTSVYILKDRNGRSQGTRLEYTFCASHARYEEKVKSYDPHAIYGKSKSANGHTGGMVSAANHPGHANPTPSTG